MTDTEKAVLERRIDELCAEVEYARQTSRSRLERIDELCAEVERGKAEFKKMDVWHSQELKAAMDENAKLREQVEYMTPIALYAASEQERDRMRELGIEVD